MISRCSELEPTVPEVYTVKSRILKHAGDVEGAAASAVRAQSLDLADRCSIPHPPLTLFSLDLSPSWSAVLISGNCAVLTRDSFGLLRVYQ